MYSLDDLDPKLTFFLDPSEKRKRDTFLSLDPKMMMACHKMLVKCYSHYTRFLY